MRPRALHLGGLHGAGPGAGVTGEVSLQDRQQGGAQARGLSACTTCPSPDPPPTSAPCKTPLRSVRLSICQSPVVPISPLPRCSAPTGSRALLWTPVRLSLAGPSPARWPWAPRVSPFGAALGGGAAAARTSEPRLATTVQRRVPRCRLRLPRPPRPRRGTPGRCHQPSALTGGGGGPEGLPRTRSRPDPRGQSRTASTSACGRPGCVASGVTPVGTAVPSDSDGGDCIRQGLRRGRGWEALDVRSASELMRVRKPPAEEDTRATETGVT